MLEWTGERFLPWRIDPALAYEHLHRYLYASQFVSGKTVLDLASGEGYGSNLLAETAEKVVAIDIDSTTIDHARGRYLRPNLKFMVGTITEVPVQESACFDVVVCFEAIEHIEDHDKFLSEVCRLLKPDGVLLVSTPNKKVYDESIQEENKFHVKELEFDEFQTLLEARFKWVRFLGQRVYAQSNLWPIYASNAGKFKEYVVERKSVEFETVPAENLVPLYYIGVASNSPPDADLPRSILVDNRNELLSEKDRALQAGVEALAWKTEHIESLEKGLKWREEQLNTMEKDLTWSKNVVADLKAAASSQEEALAWRAEQVGNLEKEASELKADLRQTSHQLNQTTEQLEAIHSSSGWKLITKIRRVRDRVFPPGSSRNRLLTRALDLFR